MIVRGSRYTATSETRNGTTQNVANNTKFSSPSTMVVIASEGQSMEILAAMYLNDATQYWKIADVNPQIAFPDYLPAGTPVRVPIV